MLLPQFSLRTILIVVSATGVLSLVFARAVAGSAWAVGIAVGAASLLAAMLVYAAFFVGCSALSRIVGAEEIVVRTSRGGVQQDDAAGAPSPALPSVPTSESTP